MKRIAPGKTRYSGTEPAKESAKAEPETKEQGTVIMKSVANKTVAVINIEKFDNKHSLEELVLSVERQIASPQVSERSTP